MSGSDGVDVPGADASAEVLEVAETEAPSAEASAEVAEIAEIAETDAPATGDVSIESAADVPEGDSASDATDASTESTEDVVPTEDDAAEVEEVEVVVYEPDPVLLESVELARAGLREITDDSTIGDVVGFQAEGEHVLSIHFATRLRGYPGWHWTATVARADDGSEPTVLETELLPGEDALLAPEWVPWSERLADWRAAQAAAAEAAAEAESEESDDESEGDDDQLDGDDDDVLEDEDEDDEDEDDALDDLDEDDLVDDVDDVDLDDLDDEALDPDAAPAPPSGEVDDRP